MCEHEFSMIIKTDGKAFTKRCLECNEVFIEHRVKQDKKLTTKIIEFFRKEN